MFHCILHKYSHYGSQNVSAVSLLVSSHYHSIPCLRSQPFECVGIFSLRLVNLWNLTGDGPFILTVLVNLLVLYLWRPGLMPFIKVGYSPVLGSGILFADASCVGRVQLVTASSGC